MYDSLKKKGGGDSMRQLWCLPPQRARATQPNTQKSGQLIIMIPAKVSGCIASWWAQYVRQFGREREVHTCILF